MNARSVVDALVAKGLDPREAGPKEQLFERAWATFQREIGERAVWGVWVPGRLELFGTHTDYAGGRTLVAALPRGFIFLGRGRSDGRIRLIDAVQRQVFSAQLPLPQSPMHSPGWHRYAQVVINRLERNFSGASLGADLVFASDLPMAAGMSSSSALMVGVAASLVQLSGIRNRPPWRENIRDALDEAGYYACIENGSTFGTLAGDEGVGTHGGSEDHAAMVCGAGGALAAFAFAPMRPLDTVRLPDGWRAAAMTSGVLAEKTGAVRTFYNHLSRGTALLTELWNRCEGPAPSLSTALASAPGAVDRLRAAIRTAHAPGWSREDLEARLEHFIKEDARIPAAVAALRNHDVKTIGVLAASSQTDSEQLLRNQVEETVACTQMARACGAFAARSFGAGFGGSVWALTTAEHLQAFMEAWHGAYRAAYPAHPSVTLLAQPGPAAAELAL